MWHRELRTEQVWVGRTSDREEAVPVSSARTFGYAQQKKRGKPRHAEVRPYVCIQYDAGFFSRLLDVVTAPSDEERNDRGTKLIGSAAPHYSGESPLARASGRGEGFLEALERGEFDSLALEGDSVHLWLVDPSGSLVKQFYPGFQGEEFCVVDADETAALFRLAESQVVLVE